MITNRHNVTSLTIYTTGLGSTCPGSDEFLFNILNKIISQNLDKLIKIINFDLWSKERQIPALDRLREIYDLTIKFVHAWLTIIPDHKNCLVVNCAGTEISDIALLNDTRFIDLSLHYPPQLQQEFLDRLVLVDNKMPFISSWKMNNTLEWIDRRHAHVQRQDNSSLIITPRQDAASSSQPLTLKL